MFLPQLLMSAEAAKSAFAVLKEKMDKSGEVQEKKGKIVLATVKGDIHDIGKNIVKVLLENYSFEVIDLGKDVAPELIVDTVREQDICLVGLSALMTTTVVSMEETIRQLREKAPGCLVMVGGARAQPGLRGHDRGGFLRKGRHAVRTLCAGSICRLKRVRCISCTAAEKT